jgi:hypothetical protein
LAPIWRGVALVEQADRRLECLAEPGGPRQSDAMALQGRFCDREQQKVWASLLKTVDSSEQLS